MPRLSRGSVERVNRTWFGRLPSSNKRIRLGSTTELRSKVQASAALDRYRELLNPNTLEPGPAVRATEYFEKYLSIHAVLFRVTTQRRVRSQVRNHLKAFAGKQLSEIDTPSIQAFIASMADKHSRGTIRSIRDTLLMILRQARRDGFGVHRIATRDLKLPSEAKPERRSRWISNDELLRILEASPTPWKALWAVLGYAGLRIGEGLGLTWEHVDFATRQISLRQACVAGDLAPLKTRNSRADLPMLPQLEAVLREYQAVWRPNSHGLLFASGRGTPLRADDVRTRRLHPLLQKLQLPKAGCHAFRHGLSSRLVAAGCSQKVIQSFLRHANAAETERYTHIAGRDLSEAIESAAKRLPQLEPAS